MNTCSTNTLATAHRFGLLASERKCFGPLRVQIHACQNPDMSFLGGPCEIDIVRTARLRPQASTAPALSVFLGGFSVHFRHLRQNAQYFSSTQTNKTLVLFGPTFFGSRSVQTLFQRGTISVLRQLCFVVAATVKVQFAFLWTISVTKHKSIIHLELVSFRHRLFR